MPGSTIETAKQVNTLERRISDMKRAKDLLEHADILIARHYTHDGLRGDLAMVLNGLDNHLDEDLDDMARIKGK